MVSTCDQTIASTAGRYFNYLGTHLPYQTAGDEFYFQPRCEAAVGHLGSLDILDTDRISAHLEHVRELSTLLHTEPGADLETEIDRITLKQSMERFLWQFGQVKVWRSDPTLYTKIPVFAVDEVISREAAPVEEVRDPLLALLSQIPQFLEKGLTNLHKPSDMALEVARDMTADALAFFQSDVPLFIEERFAADRELISANSRACESWEEFHTGLSGLHTGARFAVGPDGLAEIFSKGVGMDVPLDEIVSMAQEGFRTIQEKLAALAETVSRDKNWPALLQETEADADGSVDLLDLYATEVKNLRELFHAHDLISLPQAERVEVHPTPSYLQAIRATASYRAPLTGSNGQCGVFHISPSDGSSGLIRAHCAYLSAHETYPGHHILDAIRLGHANPIRRQIEAPLFYEGWACYAETLLDELDYITDPRLQMVQLQRQLWRNMRSILDVKLQTRAITTQAAAKEIESIGFPRSVAERQIRRFSLTPGYQSCYFLGMSEILRLRKRYAPVLGLKGFHDTLLQGGQIRFDLAEKRLEAAAREVRK